jgi:hypothetical protein
LPGIDADPLREHTAGDWVRDVGITAGLAIVCRLFIWIQLRRLGPRRRR